MPILLGLAAVSPPARAVSVGFDLTQMPRPGQLPLPAAFWYPSQSQPAFVPKNLGEQFVALNGKIAGDRLPLVVISHGALGSWSSHDDVAAALARAGFVVASITHDDLGSGFSLKLKGRNLQLSALITFALHVWRGHAAIDPSRIGAFGFSIGGFTALVAAGGKPDATLIAPHCKAFPADWSCRNPTHVMDIRRDPPPPSAWSGDLRIKAAVIAVPALGYTFGKAGLAGIHIPIQLWQAANDHTLARPWSAEAVKDNLPNPPDFHLVEDADHSDFVAPCSPTALRTAPQICRDSSGFDRIAFHQTFDKAVTAFFVHWLAPTR